ncbi:MAG: hypothetical protein Kow0081_5140 [Candidatus Dojkabacteria bacterium]
MNYAIIKIGPFQYTVEEGKEYTVPNFEAKKGKFSDFEVLFTAIGDKVEVGTPKVEKAKVEIEVLGQEKGEKVTTRIYRAKSRYRRTIGHRKTVTRFKVNKIA